MEFRSIELYEMLKKKTDKVLEKKLLRRYTKPLLEGGYIQYKKGKIVQSDKPIEPFNNLTKIHDLVQRAIENDITFTTKEIQEQLNVPYTTVVKYLQYLKRKGKIKKEGFRYCRTTSRNKSFK